jgi:hypothetical protein
MAREVALTELQERQANLSADHSAQLDRLSLHVRHEDSQAQTNLHDINQRLAASTASAQDAAARAAAAWQANHHLEEELLQARATAHSPEWRYTEAMQANAVITKTAMNFDEVRRQELEIEAQLKQHWYQEALASSQTTKSNEALYIQERKDNIALIEKVKQLEHHLKNITDKDADRSVDQSATPSADRSSEQSVKDKVEFAPMKQRIDSYETQMADMAAQAEVDRQKYAHRLSELQREPPVDQNDWTYQDMNNIRRADHRTIFEPGAETPLRGISAKLPSAWTDCKGDSPRSTRPMMAVDEGVSSDDASSENDTTKEKKKTKITIKEADSITFSALPPPQKFRQWRLAFRGNHKCLQRSRPCIAVAW